MRSRFTFPISASHRAPKAVRLFLAATAVGSLAVLAACAEGPVASKITGNTDLSPRFNHGVVGSLDHQVLVCVDLNSSAAPTLAGYSFTAIKSPVPVSPNFEPASAGPPVTPGDQLFSPTVAVGACELVFLRPSANNVIFPGNLNPYAKVQITATVPAGYTVEITSCVNDDVGLPQTCVLNVPGQTVAQSSANIFHGSSVTFKFTLIPTQGCTYTIGRYKNKSNAAIAGNTNFDGSGKSETEILNTPSLGNPYIILAKQYIAAKANQAGGATIVGDALTAYNAATAYFAGAATIANPLAGGYTKTQLTDIATILDNYNNGIAGQGNPLHCVD